MTVNIRTHLVRVTRLTRLKNYVRELTDFLMDRFAKSLIKRKTDIANVFIYTFRHNSTFETSYYTQRAKEVI